GSPDSLYAAAPPRALHSFPTRRSSDLDPDDATRWVRESVRHARRNPEASAGYVAAHAQEMDPEVQRSHIALYVNDFTEHLGDEGDRKSTRLNSSHRTISYAVFCLKKKN